MIIPFPFDIQFIAFSFNYVFYSNFFLTTFLQFFFIETSSNSFTISVTNYIKPRNFIFNFTNKQIFFWPFGAYPSAKAFLSNESLSNNRFSFILCWKHFNVVCLPKLFKGIIVKFATLINPYFIWFSSSEIIFSSALTILTPFLSFEVRTQAYLLKT